MDDPLTRGRGLGLLRQRRAGRLGQAVTEFALVVPVLMLALMGCIDAGLLMFSVGTASQAVGEGARVGAEAGNSATADTQIVAAIKGTALGSTTLVQITHIDIYHLNESGVGVLTKDAAGCGGGVGCINYYDLNGNSNNGQVTPRWVSTTRNVTYGSSDFLGVTINYTYTWKSGFLIRTTPLQLTAVYYVRLEPQTY